VAHGYSSPIVAQGRVHVTDAELQGGKATERVVCFEETTGKRLWMDSREVSYPDWAFTPGQEKGPNSTPIVRDGKLYVLGSLGRLACFDARTGAVLWERDLAKEYQFPELSTPNASPLIEGGLLIVMIGGKPDAGVIALHRDSGKEAWRALDESAGHSSPIVISAGGARQLIVWTQQSVSALEPMTGKPLWRERLLTSADSLVSSPVFSSGRLLIAGLMLKLDEDKPAATVLWPRRLAASDRILSNTSTALLAAGHVFSARSSGELVCLDASTGEKVWETNKVTDLKGGASIHLTPNGDSVLLFNDRGELIRARLDAHGYTEISRTALIEPTYPFAGRKVIWTPPAYANLHVFARNEREILCASLEPVP
jgi:outer membrane protein assembly factor BamB